jgi:hypothetical protein
VEQEGREASEFGGVGGAVHEFEKNLKGPLVSPDHDGVVFLDGSGHVDPL